MSHPQPIAKEIYLNPKKYIVSKTDKKGIIEYVNDYFIEISGYSKEELLYKPHNIIRHPDMPRIVFKLMWDRIQMAKSITAVVKNLAKDGRYYWVITEFESKIDKTSKEIISYTAFRKAAPRNAIQKIEPIYKKLCELEKNSGILESEKFLVDFLNTKKMSYDQFLDDLVENKSTLKRFFDKIIKKENK